MATRRRLRLSKLKPDPGQLSIKPFLSKTSNPTRSFDLINENNIPIPHGNPSTSIIDDDDVVILDQTNSTATKTSNQNELEVISNDQSPEHLISKLKRLPGKKAKYNLISNSSMLSKSCDFTSNHIVAISQATSSGSTSIIEDDVFLADNYDSNSVEHPNQNAIEKNQRSDAQSLEPSTDEETTPVTSIKRSRPTRSSVSTYRSLTNIYETSSDSDSDDDTMLHNDDDDFFPTDFNEDADCDEKFDLSNSNGNEKLNYSHIPKEDGDNDTTMVSSDVEIPIRNIPKKYGNPYRFHRHDFTTNSVRRCYGTVNPEIANKFPKSNAHMALLDTFNKIFKHSVGDLTYHIYIVYDYSKKCVIYIGRTCETLAERLSCHGRNNRSALYGYLKNNRRNCVILPLFLQDMTKTRAYYIEPFLINLATEVGLSSLLNDDYYCPPHEELDYLRLKSTGEERQQLLSGIKDMIDFAIKHYHDDSKFHHKAEFVRYPCNRCSRALKSHRQMIKHQNSHINKVQIVCTYEGCTKLFKTDIGLNRHIKKEHLGIRYPCDECGQSFTEKQSLKLHCLSKNHSTTCLDSLTIIPASRLIVNSDNILVTQPKKTYICPTCNAKFRDVIKLRIHIERKIKCEPGDLEKNTICPKCKKDLKKPWRLARHLNAKVVKCKPTSDFK